MIHPITGFNIKINPDGTGTLSAPDFQADGHAWALEGVLITLDQLRQVADILGINDYVHARLVEELRRADESAARIDGWIEKARADHDRADYLRKALGK